ncbi:MAG TPA: alpha/beta fold hydrolase [Gemmatimonadaceae bacterium]
MISIENFQIERKRPEGGKPLVIRGEVFLPDAPQATIVILHGFKGFAHFAHFPYLARKAADAGIRAVTFDFSGSGIGPDRENFTALEEFQTNTFRQELADVEQVISESVRRGWITRERGYGLMGHSRGGGVAILRTARDPRVKALATWNAVSTTVRWSAEARDDWRRRGYVDIENARTKQMMRLGTALLDEVESLSSTELDIAAAAARIRVPWLIVHGEADETVPVAEGQQLRDLSRSVSTFWKVEGGNHGFGGKHPLTEVPPLLDMVVRGTVNFFADNLGVSAPRRSSEAV